MTIENIWDEYSTALKRFLQSRVSNPADVDDLLQDILLKSHLNLHSLASMNSVKSWVFQIANNVIIDHYRKKGRANDLDVDDLWYEDDAPNIKRELSTCIAPFIKALPDESAHILEEIELNNMTQKDYAAANNINYSTLKTRVQKARKQLRELVEDCCHLTLDKNGNIIEFQQKGKSCRGCS